MEGWDSVSFELTNSLTSLGEPVSEYLVRESIEGAEESPVFELAVEAFRDLDDHGTSRILIELIKLC